MLPAGALSWGNPPLRMPIRPPGLFLVEPFHAADGCSPFPIYSILLAIACCIPLLGDLLIVYYRVVHVAGYQHQCLLAPPSC